MIAAMAIFPLVFLVQPTVAAVVLPRESASNLTEGHLLLYLLGIPVLTPAILAAYAVAGERQQGSLEPMLSTPISRQELLVGKALAAAVPSILLAYAAFALFMGVLVAFAKPEIASALLRPSDVAAQFIFTPLLATGAVWIAVAVSTRTSDGRTAQQLSLLLSLPLVLGPALVAFDVIHPTLRLAVIAGALLLVADIWGWRLVGPLLDRERLITGSG